MDGGRYSSMLDGMDIVERLESVEQRLDRLAAGPPVAGLTDPDPGGTERWDAGQVWAHMAEFVDYWHGQLQQVVGEYDGTPVPFGRTKADADRIAGIEATRYEPVAVLRARVRGSVAAVRSFLAGLTPPAWNAVGLHPTLGEMDVEAVVERFITGHLEEHADQLDGLE
jgi:DinB superfamily